MKQNEIQFMVISGKRWFDRVNGNTYHSCSVVVNGELVGVADFKYGYSDHYKQTALEILQEGGYFLEGQGEHTTGGAKQDYNNFFQWCMDNRNKVVFTVADVGRKRDL